MSAFDVIGLGSALKEAQPLKAAASKLKARAVDKRKPPRADMTTSTKGVAPTTASLDPVTRTPLSAAVMAGVSQTRGHIPRRRQRRTSGARGYKIRR
jgi:hypothetical protein